MPVAESTHHPLLVLSAVEAWRIANGELLLGNHHPRKVPSDECRVACDAEPTTQPLLTVHRSLLTCFFFPLVSGQVLRDREHFDPITRSRR